MEKDRFWRSEDGDAIIEKFNDVVFTYFDIMYQDGKFIESIQGLLDKTGANTQGAVFTFTEVYDPGSERYYNMVYFSYGEALYEDMETIVSEAEAFYYARLACTLYKKRRPQDSAIIDRLVAQFPV